MALIAKGNEPIETKGLEGRSGGNNLVPYHMLVCGIQQVAKWRHYLRRMIEAQKGQTEKEALRFRAKLTD